MQALVVFLCSPLFRVNFLLFHNIINEYLTAHDTVMNVKRTFVYALRAEILGEILCGNPKYLEMSQKIRIFAALKSNQPKSNF